MATNSRTIYARRRAQAAALRAGEDCAYTEGASATAKSLPDASAVYANRRAQVHGQQDAHQGARVQTHTATQPMPAGAVLRTLPLPRAKFD